MMRTRIPAAIAAIVGWAGLVLQLSFLFARMGLVAGLWRSTGFYTILTNLGAASVATAVALGSRSALASGRARLIAATSIVMVGLVYTAALRGLWNPVGLRKVADVTLHDVVPIIWLLFWIVSAPCRLRWSDLFWALVPPGVYLIYALGRGALDGWYAYWFLDPSRGSGGEMAMSIVILLSSFALVATILIAIDRAKSRRARREKRRPGLVDEAGIESFPASDPPAWTLGEEAHS